MCGILTLIKMNYNEKDINSFEISLNKMKYRGPDNTNIIKKKNILLGHNRLKILDLSEKSNQPFEYKNFSLIFNGCIYNFKELRNELKNKYTFKTTGDTEVLMYSLIEWGEKAFNKIDGMYAFVFYDGKKIITSVDYFGEKPLYIYKDENEILISSEIAPLKIYLKDKLIIKKNPIQFKEFYHLGFLLGEETVYKNIFKLSNKKIYSIDENLNIKKLDKIDLKYKKFNVTFKDIHEELLNSLKNRLNSDVPLCLFLSTGIDSALLATLIKKELKIDLDFYSFYNENEKKSKEYLLNFTNYLGVKTKIISNEEQNFEYKNFKKAYEDLNECDTYFPYDQMCKYIKQNTDIKVILTGLGADEIFFGYNKYKYFYKFRRLYKLNDKLYKFFNFFGDKLNLNILKKSKFFTGKNFTKFLKIKNNDYNINYDQIEEFNEEQQLFLSARNFDINNTMPISLIPAIERASMRSSLETRSPYLSKKLFDLVNCIEDYSMFFKEQKYIQKKILRKYLPEKFIPNVKEGFFYNNPNLFNSNDDLQKKYNLKFTNYRYNQRAEIYNLF